MTHTHTHTHIHTHTHLHTSDPPPPPLLPSSSLSPYQDHNVKTAVETMRTEVPRLTAKIRKTALLHITNEEMAGTIHRLENAS